MKARSSFAIQRDVIFAIFVREMISRFSTYTFGNVWLVLEPLLMMVFYVLLFGARGRGAYGFVEAPVFIFSAFLSFRLLWNSTMRKATSARGAARGLLGYRQVRLFDVFIARGVVEAGLYVLVGFLLGVGLYWFDYDPTPDNFLRVVQYSLLLWLLALSFGMLACMIGSVAREVEKLITMMTMPLMFLSAVLFPMSIVPREFWAWMTWNPVLHAMELIREAWFAAYESPVASPTYLIAWVLVLMAVAMSTYRLTWQRVVSR